MFIPELKTVTLTGDPHDGEPDFLKELSTGVYIELYAAWKDCSDSKDRKLTLQRLMATVVLLSLWKDNKPYLRECFIERSELIEEEVEKLPLDLGPLMRYLIPDQIVQTIDFFADRTSDTFMRDTDGVIDKAFHTLSHLRDDAGEGDDSKKK